MKRALVALLIASSSGFAPAAAAEKSAVVAPAPTSQGGLTLKDAFMKASRTSETLVIQSEEIEQAKARYRQTRGGILPNFRFIGTETIQDTTGVNSGNVDRGSSTSRERTEARLNLTQPLFQGFKEFAALSGLRSEERRQQILLRRQSTELFQVVATSFFNVVNLETSLSDVRTLMKLSSDRTKELKERANLGKSRVSEVTTAESQYAVYKAEEASLVGQIAVAREELSYLVGEDLSATPIDDNVGLPRVAPPLAELLPRMEDRSDVAALREEVEGRRAGVRVAKAGYWPSLTANGNYYLKRPGNLEEIDWDVIFTLNAPIYQGGAVKGLQDEANSLLRQSEQGLSRQRRLATADIRKAHALLEASIQRSSLLEDAVAKLKKTYELMSREYRLGLNNNLDVIQAMNSLLNAKRDYDLALLQSKLNLLNLRLAVEMAPENLP